MTNQTLVKEICPSSALKFMNRSALFVDVREVEELKVLAFDVPNIINIPLSEFEERYTEVPTDIEVVVVCRGGVRSLRATGFLINHGYNREKVVNMENGIIRWVKRGFPTIGDKDSVSNDESGDSCCSASKPKVGITDLKTKTLKLEGGSCCS